MRKKSLLLRLLSICLATIIIFSFVFGTSYAKDESFTSRYSQTQYNDKNGLPDNSINDILATSDGVMWFASSSGLIKYNSKSFQLINKNNSNDFGAMDAVKLFEDSQKRLWVGTNDGGVICRSKDGTKTINTKSGAASNSIRDIKELSTGVIVVASANGLFYIDKDFNVTVIEIPNEISSKNSFSPNTAMICVNQKDNIFGITGTGSVFSVIDNKVTSYAAALGNYVASCIYAIGDNVFRIGTASGDIIDFTRNGGTDFTTSIIKTNLASIMSMYKDSKENWWVLADNGIGYLDENKVFVDVDNLYINNYIDTMYEDYQGNYWFGSKIYGVLKLSKSSFVNYNSEQSLEKFLATSITVFDKKTYIASDNGLKILDEQTGEKINNSLTELLKNTKIKILQSDSDNNLWIGTVSNGLVRYGHDGGIKIFTKADGIAGTRIQEIVQSKNGNIVVGTNEGVSIISGNKVIKTYSYNENVGVSVRSIYEDAQYSLYLGTSNNGILKINSDGQVQSFSEKDSFPSGSVVSMAKDPANEGWWVSAGINLCYVSSDNKIKTIDKVSISRNIIDIFFAPDGYMWVVTPSEMIVLNTDNLLSDTESLSAVHIGKSVGLSSNVFPLSNNYISPEGILYLCCEEGINTINTLDYKISQPAPKITLNTIATETMIYPSEGPVTIPADSKQLSFSVSVLSYSEYSDCKISYILEGLDKKPIIISADSASIITYSNLKGGTYKFKISAVNAGKTVGNIISVDIEKELSVIEKSFFKASIASFIFLLLVILTYIFIIIRVRNTRKKQKAFKQFTDQSITAISKVVDAKDQYTRGHSERVAKYSAEVAKRYGLKSKRIEDIYYSALLHDIGKIGVPDYILKKPHSLTDEEFEIMKTHTSIGAEILSTVNAIDGISNGARDHHEKFNGTGYPRGLKGLKISIEGRIVGAADAYDAMSTERGYSKAIDKEFIISEIKSQKGQQFDPRMAEIIIQMIKDGYFDR